MKRPPGLWLLLSAGVLWLNMQDAYGIRATALIFGRGSTTSTTEAPVSEEAQITESDKIENNANSTQTPANSTSTNSTKPLLTGIPQIDYIYDPNLPRELNGYNLSEYPFYDRVPDDIVFKCDGLHDGFYASVPHKCQVYHHCLFGTRYDFLCANYTAFDQTTFICHFVSEVDCNNSHKFWHRNDALYKAATTTTPKPIFIPPPTTAPPPPVSIRPSAIGGLGGRRRKPFRRPRPQYDYYYDDEEYEQDDYEPPPPRQRGRRKRPRPRPRPVYEDDYEEYEDDRYERRGSGRRGGNDRNRRPYDDRRDYDEDTYDKRRGSDERRRKEEKADDEIDDRRPYKNDERRHDKRRPSDERNYENSKKNDKRSEDDEEYYDEETNNRRKNDRPKKNKYLDDEEEPPRETSNEKAVVKPVSGSSIYGQPRKAPRIRPPVPKNEQNKYNYKSSKSSSTTTTTTASPKKQVDEADYYEDEDLPPPRSKPRPKPTTTTKRPNKPSSERSEAREPSRTTGYGSRPRGGYRKPVDDDIDDDYEEERTKPRRPYRYRPKGRNGGNRKRPPIEDEFTDDDDDDMETAKSQNKQKSTSRTENKSDDKKSNEQTTEATKKEKDIEEVKETTTVKSIEPGKGHHQPFVRVVKRPFLPSRGGNPYSSRGLKPVGAKSLDENPGQENPIEHESENKYNKENSIKDEETTTTSNQAEKETDAKTPSSALQNNSRNEAVETQSNLNAETRDPSSYRSPDESSDEIKEKPAFKPSPQIIKVPVAVNNRYNDPYVEEPEEEPIKPVQNRPLPRPNYKVKYTDPPRTTSKPYYDDKSPLDITDESEYDVTLNEAINPTLPNLPVRSYPTGFSTSQDYSYNNFQRPRVNQNFKPSYQLRPTNHGTIIVPHNDEGPYISAEDGYNPNLQSDSQPYRSQNFRASPHVTQVRTQPYFSY